MQGILFDLPAVVERAKANIEAAGLADRCRVVAGNFFEAVPPGADAYLMRHIIHDWDDEKSLTILKNCRQAMGERAGFWSSKAIVPPGNEPSISKFFDLAMMVLPGRHGTDGRRVSTVVPGGRISADSDRADEDMDQRDRGGGRPGVRVQISTRLEVPSETAWCLVK